MNLVRIGKEWVNFDLAKGFREPPCEGAGAVPGRVELVFLDGSTMAFDGAEGDALRRYLNRNSASLDLEGGAADFAPGEGSLFAKPQGGKQGA